MQANLEAAAQERLAQQKAARETLIQGMQRDKLQLGPQYQQLRNQSNFQSAVSKDAANDVYALVARCTHLGCTPNWLAAQNKFKCPCHGSGYYMSGVNFEGPTPRPLERAEIGISADDGQLVVDTATRFLYERGQWSDPKSFVKMV
jgi:Rieske Fe-S protein